MNSLHHRFLCFLVLALLSVPIAWAVSFTGMNIRTLQQLSFDTRSVQPGAPSTDAMTRRLGDGPYTLMVVSPYSRGAITYASSVQGVATVNPATGEVTPRAIGQTVITATQAALAPFPAATARYTLTLTGTDVTYEPWTLADRRFGEAGFNLGATPPTSTSSSPFKYSSATPDIVTVTEAGEVTLRKVGTATVVARQDAVGAVAAGEVRATFQVLSADPVLAWEPLQLRLGGAALSLTPPVSPNSAAFSYTVADSSVAEVQGNQVIARRAGITSIAAHQDASGNYNGATITQSLVVLPAQLSVAGLPQTIQHVLDVQTPANNTITLTPQVTVPAGGAAPVFLYDSSDTNVATFSGNALTLGPTPGTATLTVRLVADTNGQYEEASAAPIALTVLAPEGSARVVPELSISVGSQVYGDPDFTPVVSTNSSGRRRFTSSNPAVASVNPDTGAVSIAGAGETRITVSLDADASTFGATSAAATLTVAKRTAQLGVASVVRALSAGAFPLTIGGRSSGGLTLSIDKPDVATFAGGGTNWTITPLKADKVVVTVSQAADANHLADTATATLEFTPLLAPSIQWAPPSQWLFNPSGSNTFTLPQPVSNSNGGFRFEIEAGNGSVATVAGDVVTVVGIGTATLKAVQAASGSHAESAVTSQLNVVSQLGNVTMPQGAGTTATIEVRYRDVQSFEVNSVPSALSGVDPLTWSVSYASNSPGVLSVSGSTATLVSPGDATIVATWSNPGTGQSVMINHPFRVLKSLPNTRLNFVSPLVQAFASGSTVTPPILTSSDAPIKLRSDDPDVALVVNNGTSLQMGAPAVVRIAVSQDETETYERFSGEFVLELKADTLALSGFPDRTFTLDPLSPQQTLPRPTSASPAEFQYTSSNTGVAEVVSGKLVLKAPGWTEITATQNPLSPYGSGSIKATYTVLAANAGLAFQSGGADTVLVNEPVFVVARSKHELTPVTYSSSNALVATVDATTGQVSAHSPGTVEIVARQAAAGVYDLGTAVKTLQVRHRAGLQLDPITTRVGAASFVPAWRSDSHGRVTVNVEPIGSGVVSLTGNTIAPTGVGTVQVTLAQEATSSHAAGTASATLTVEAAAPVISGLPSVYSKTHPATQTFDLPALSSTNPSTPLAFSSSNTSVATIAANGSGSATVTLLAAGETVLTVSQGAAPPNWDAGSATVRLIVTSGGAVAPLSLESRSLPFGSPDFALTSQPAGVTGAISGYRSSSPTVAEILPDGFTVSIRDVGVTTLSALQNGQVVATGVLTVVKADQTLAFSDRTVSLASGPNTTLQAAASSGGLVSFAITGGDPGTAHLGDDGKTLWLLWNSMWALSASDGRDAQVSITATQAGNARYKPASVTRVFTVHRPADVQPWYQIVGSNLPATVPSIIDGGAQVHQLRLRHNMAPGMFNASLRPLGSGSTMQCRIDSIQHASSPEGQAVITTVFQGGVGQCRLVMYANDNDYSLPVVLATVDSSSSQYPVPPSTVVWPNVVVTYGDAQGVPAAPFAFANDTWVTAQTPGVVALSGDSVNNRPGYVSAGNNPPRVVGVGVGTTTLMGTLSSDAGGGRVSTTATVVAATPVISGWDSTVALSFSPEGEAFQVPLSSEAV